jgi:hypothetical protein
MGSVKKLLEERIPGVYVLSLMIGRPALGIPLWGFFKPYFSLQNVPTTKHSNDNMYYTHGGEKNNYGGVGG